MASSSRLRNHVHAELTVLLDPTAGPLGQPPPDVEAILDDALINEVAVEYRAQTPEAPTEGRAAIITAGPPGAGKSTALRTLLEDHRRIDPDEVKDLLLARLEAAGLLAERHRYTLLDGRPVQPSELAGWVHHASTTVADLVQQVSMANGENFAREGTLSWKDLADDYTHALAANDYETLTVLDVEVPLNVASDQARRRWWAGRNTDGALGGRFISDAAIGQYYPNTPRVSACAIQARALYDEANLDGINTTLALETRTASGTTTAARVHTTGIEAFQGLPLGAVCIRCGSRLSGDRSIRRGLGDDCRRHLAS